jgi:hypothetical protein
VYDLAQRFGVKAGNDLASVRLTQAGRMKRSLDVETWMKFTAIQTISTHVCEFDWRASAGPFDVSGRQDVLDLDFRGCRVGHGSVSFRFPHA